MLENTMEPSEYQRRISRAYGRGSPPKDRYFLGLDLGQANDYTALAVLRESGPERGLYDLGKLERYDLGTPYPEIVASVKAMVDKLREQPAIVYLAVDATGVGRPVVDLFDEAGLSVTPITFTSGHEVTRGEQGGYNVPKRDLVSTAKVALQTRVLRSSPEIPLAKVFREELLKFRVKISLKGKDTYEAWREGDHDDLVMAVAMALWVAGQVGPGVAIVECHYY